MLFSEGHVDVGIPDVWLSKCLIVTSSLRIPSKCLATGSSRFNKPISAKRRMPAAVNCLETDAS